MVLTEKIAKKFLVSTFLAIGVLHSGVKEILS